MTGTAARKSVALLVAGCLFITMPALSASQAGKRLLRYEDFAHLDLAGPVARHQLEMLGHSPGELPFARVLDLDGDGVEEVFLTTPASRLCGTAGCPYLLLEGTSGRALGEFFGTIAIAAKSLGGFPVLHVINRRDAGRTLLQVYVFDGVRYVLLADALLEAAGMDAWSSDVAW